MSNEITKEPEIRFDGYEGDWEERKVGEVFSERSERSGEGELISVTINSGVVKASELDRKDNSSDDKSNYKKVEVGDIAYNSMRMWQGASGYSPYNGILSPAYTVIIPKKDIDSKFFAYDFKRYDMIQTFKRNSQGLTSDTWNLKFPTLKSVKVMVPSIEEQKQISTFFESLDTTITLHQRELDLLEQTKQTYLKKMFPKTGEDKPEIRFAGFTDAWEQRKLGEVFQQTVEYIDPKEAGLELWSVTVENGLTPKSERYNREFLVKKNDKFKAIHPDEIVYNPMNMTLGSIGFNNSGKDVAVSGYYVTMKLNEGFDTKYFATWLPSPNAINLYKLYATGSLIERQRVQFPTLSGIKTLMPSLNEQKQIGLFFKQLDTTTALHQRELDSLKEMKKTLLQKMFV
ncbi:type I restriction enzyme, S subunit [Enterococcus sp. DIV0181]|uniref:restriction endonuclease subunit S n=2 Tax=Enterococcus TaxID=1350 RepID=UPI003D2FE1C7